jgi:hypothetical protein
MKLQDIIDYRLVNQQISHATAKTPEDVVLSLGAMQAQNYLGALWAIGLRLPNSTQTTVERAIVQKKIVRTWPIRGTLHFVSPADVRWMLDLLPEHTILSYQKRIGLNEAVLKIGKHVLANAFKVQEQLTRDELYLAFKNSRVPALNNRDVQRHIIRKAGLDGLICFGSHNGKQPTFTLLDNRVPKSDSLTREEALTKIARKYFTGHGPATLKDFVWWSGLRMSDALAGIKMAAPHLTQEKVDGVCYWMSENILEFHDPSPTAHLLPAFDEYLIGYKDRSAVLSTQHSNKVVPGGNGMFLPVVLVDGQVVGTWKSASNASTIKVVLKLFNKLSSASLESIAIAAEHYGEFLGKPVTLSLENLNLEAGKSKVAK